MAVQLTILFDYDNETLRVSTSKGAVTNRIGGLPYLVEVEIDDRGIPHLEGFECLRVLQREPETESEPEPELDALTEEEIQELVDRYEDAILDADPPDEGGTAWTVK